MAKQITKTVYTYAELLDMRKKDQVTQKAVDRARQWLTEVLSDDGWYESTIEDWKTALAQVGFTDADIAFSGFWSQGDGASFTAKLDIAKLVTFLSTPIKGEPVILDGEPNGWLAYIVDKLGAGKVTNDRYGYLTWILDNLSGQVTRTDGRYSHENTCRAAVELDDRKSRPEIETLVNAFEKDVEALRYKLSKIIYRALEEDYNGRVSDESVNDFAHANDYTFEANGRREG